MRTIIQHGKHHVVCYVYVLLFLNNVARYLQIAQDATSFPTDQKIKVRVSGDGAKFSRTSSFVLLSYAILMPAGRYLSGIGKSYNICQRLSNRLSDNIF